jgi:hypoxanthine-DNA glycosylase
MRKYSFPPVYRPDARLLVCGSLPGERSLAAGRYYAHPQNQFWRLIGAAIGRDLAAMPYDARLDTLMEHRVALWDVVQSAARHGSTDAAIRDPDANDLVALAETLPDLRAIAFNGGTALRHGTRQLGEAAGRFAIVGLPSSSPLHTVGLAGKLPEWLALRRFLID